MARPTARSRSPSLAISSCHSRCCCSVSPRPSWYSCWRSSSSAFQGVSPGAAEVSFQLSSTISTLGSRVLRVGVGIAIGVAAGGLRHLVAADRGFAVVGAGAEGLEAGGALGVLLGLEHHVGFEQLADVRLQFERGQLQQLDRLLQLRGHRQLLAEAQLQGGFQHSKTTRPSAVTTCGNSDPSTPHGLSRWQGFPPHFRPRSPYRGPRCRRGCTHPGFP